MLGWLVRIVMSVAAVVAGWFVARDAANFGIVQSAISLILLTIVVAIAAFWRPFVRWWRNRR